MISVNINVTGLDQAQNKLSQLQGILTSFAPELQAVGDYLLDFYTNEVYDTQGGTYGSGWAPLSPAYAIQKAKLYPSGTILIASGHMRASNTLSVGDTSALIENTTDYAGYHQDGTPKMPARPLMLVDQERLDQIAIRFRDSLNSRINAL